MEIFVVIATFWIFLFLFVFLFIFLPRTLAMLIPFMLLAYIYMSGNHMLTILLTAYVPIDDVPRQVELVQKIIIGLSIVCLALMATGFYGDIKEFPKHLLKNLIFLSRETKKPEIENSK